MVFDCRIITSKRWRQLNGCILPGRRFSIKKHSLTRSNYEAGLNLSKHFNRKTALYKCPSHPSLHNFLLNSRYRASNNWRNIKGREISNCKTIYLHEYFWRCLWNVNFRLNVNWPPIITWVCGYCFNMHKINNPYRQKSMGWTIDTPTYWNWKYSDWVK